MVRSGCIQSDIEILNLLLSNTLLVVHTHIASNTIKFFAVVSDVFFVIIAFRANNLLYVRSPDPFFP